MPSTRPNVLWISTHDINPHLGCYTGVSPGAEQAHTPQLDALAAEGIRFDRAFAAAPVCGPSRSAIVTGCFPPALGTMHMRTRATPPADVRLLPQYFRAAGYWTGNSAFTDFQLDIPNPVYDAVGDHAHWRLREDPEQPFFMAFHGLVTHESQLYLSDAEFARRTPDAQRVDTVEVPPYHPDTEVFRTAWKRYLELISQMDHWVGTILKELDDDGLADNTIVVFWSDHDSACRAASAGRASWDSANRSLSAGRAGSDDTMLIVCTDHGFLLGERGWWGKSVQPWFDETIHTPLFVWDPDTAVAGERRDALVHTIDLAPTLLDYFDVGVPADMQGLSLRGDVRREAALFGAHGGHVNVTDGRYVYMRACADATNTPLYDFTLMPIHMRARFAPQELYDVELAPGFTFTKGAPVLRVPAHALGNPWWHGSLLFDLENDPEQRTPLADDELELRMAGHLVEQMRRNDAPAEQFARLGLPADGPVLSEHLLVERQWEQVQRALQPAVRRDDLPADAPINALTVQDVLTNHQETLPEDVLAGLRGMGRFNPSATVLEALAGHPGVNAELMLKIDAALASSTVDRMS